MTVPASLLAPLAARQSARRAELGEHTGLVSTLQADLADDVDDLRAQEGWDPATSAGASEWADDRGMVFRALRRNHFDASKAHAALLSTLSARIERGLGGVIPPSPPPGSVWSILPLPRFTTRLGHPIAVLTLRDVVRDPETGSLRELKDWVGWGLEVTRRALRDYWADGRRGTGAEGCVLVIDAGGAGYRNMEVELLPTVFRVGHNQFPGLFESVYVVNAGWSQRALWNSVVRRVLPRYALDRLSFLNSREDIEAIFEMDKFPKALGGSAPPPDLDTSLRRYAHPRPPHGAAFDSRPGSRSHSRANSRAGSRANSRGPSRVGSRAHSRDRGGGGGGPGGAGAAGGSISGLGLDRLSIPSRSTSMMSIADVYYTAHNSPVARPLSRGPSVGSSLALAGLGSRLAMTRTDREEERPERDPEHERERERERAESKPPLAPLEIEAPLPTTGGVGTEATHRIKSLTDFHLYLSPSRLAHRDLLSDSDDEDDRQPRPAPPPPRRRTLRPAMLEGNLAARRAAAKLRLAAGGTPEVGSAEGTPERAPTPAQTYASMLQAHHATGLDKYCVTDDCSEFFHLDPSYTPPGGDGSSESSISASTPATPRAADHDMDADDDHDHDAASTVATLSAHGTDTPPPPAHDVQFSADNPWWGYPVVRVPDGHDGYSIRPRYGRNRKRDLVKTLLWLFVLRLQAWRSAFERAIGLHNLFPRSAGPPPPARGPAQGLKDAARERDNNDQRAVVKSGHHDWIWMLIGFLVMRGTWAPLVSAPLDALEGVGLGAVRDLLLGFVSAA